MLDSEPSSRAEYDCDREHLQQDDDEQPEDVSHRSLSNSGAIHRANPTKRALKPINFRAKKIRVSDTACVNGRLNLMGMRLGLSLSFDEFCLASDVASCPVIVIVNFAIPKSFHGSE